MKKLILGMMLALTACVFTSCQKGENFFSGTWQSVGTYYYESKKTGEQVRDVYTVELTLSKKDGAVTWIENYPNDAQSNINRTGTYTYYNEHTISVTLAATKDEDEVVFLMYRSNKYDDNSSLYGGYYDGYYYHEYSFTRVKGNK